DILLDGDLAEVVAWTGIELEVDRRLASPAMHTELGASERDVDETGVVRGIEQRLLRGLVPRVPQHLSRRERYRLPRRAHDGLVGPFADDADVDLGDRRRRARIDDVARDPVLAVALEARLDRRIVVAERLQRR